MDGTVLQTWAKVAANDCAPFGGSKPEWFDYPNGSRVWVGGMDKPGKVLSGERDIIVVNQAEELALDDWETLTTRATGRAGHVPYPQVIGDCNPSGSTHWIKSRANVLLLESRHEDNPTLYTVDGILTERGQRTMAVLDALTGVRYQRLRLGRWVNAEGAVYEFDAAVNVIDRFEPPSEWRRIRVVDFGYSAPFVCQWWAIDHDERMYLYRELYGTRRIVEDWAEDIKRLSISEEIEATVADHDAEDRATLERHGIMTQAARKDISPGIQAVQRRLSKAGDGKPRLFMMRGALVQADTELLNAHKPTCTQQEIDVYVWPKAQDGRPIKETPVKEHDHGCLVGGTMILTNRGNIKIENVRPGDRVLTRSGFASVVNAGMTDRSADVLTVRASSGTIITGTGNHPVYVVGKGYIPLRALRYGDILVSSRECEGMTSCNQRQDKKNQKSLSTRELNSGVTQVQNHGQIGCITSPTPRAARMARADCIKKSGRIPMDLFQTGTRYITKMETRSIIPSQISNVFQRQSTPIITNRFTRKRKLQDVEKYLSMPARNLRNGIAPKRGASGTESLVANRGKVGRRKSTFASIAELSSVVEKPEKLDSVLRHAEQPLDDNLVLITRNADVRDVAKSSRVTHIANSGFAQDHVVAVTTNDKPQAVYNLTIDSAVGEYFANGILVHNCDAMRYAVMYVDGADSGGTFVSSYV